MTDRDTEIIRRRKLGESYRQIARALGVSYTTPLNVCRQHGVLLPERPDMSDHREVKVRLTPEQIERLDYIASKWTPRPASRSEVVRDAVETYLRSE